MWNIKNHLKLKRTSRSRALGLRLLSKSPRSLAVPGEGREGIHSCAHTHIPSEWDLQRKELLPNTAASSLSIIDAPLIPTASMLSFIIKDQKLHFYFSPPTIWCLNFLFSPLFLPDIKLFLRHSQ